MSSDLNNSCDYRNADSKKGSAQIYPRRLHKVHLKPEDADGIKQIIQIHTTSFLNIPKTDDVPIEYASTLLTHYISPLSKQSKDVNYELDDADIDTVPIASLNSFLKTRYWPSTNTIKTPTSNPVLESQKKLLLKPVSAEKGKASLFHNFIKNISIYAIASFMVPLSGLILVPFLTHALSHYDYGAFAILSIAISLTAGITQLGLMGAFFRAYGFDYDTTRDRAAIISTVVVILLLTSVFSTFVIVVMSQRISQILFDVTSFSDAVKIAAFVMLLQNLVLPGYAWLRSENRAVFYTIVSIINLLVNLIFTIILVGLLHMGINGALIAVGCGYIGVIMGTLLDILRCFNLRFRFDIARNLLSFGLPLVPSYISIWILQLSDRFLLGRLGSLDEAAKYTIAYTLGGILGVIVIGPFSTAWPTAMYSIAKREDASRIFQIVFRWYSLFLLFATGSLLLFSTTILYILFPPSYYSAAPIMPIVAVSIMFYGLYILFSVGASLQRKNWLLLLITSLSAFLNIGVNLILIPIYGSMGAAISTFIAYAFLAIVTYFMNQRIYPIRFEIGMFSIALFIGAALYFGCHFLTLNHAIYTTYALYIFAFILYSGWLVVLGKLRS